MNRVISGIVGKSGSNDRDVRTSSRIVSALAKLDAWIESEAFKGWDPYDALNSPLLRWTGRRQRLLGIVFVQLLRRSPFNLRPALRIGKDYNPKAMGLFLGTHARRFTASQSKEHLDKIRFFSHWLMENVSSKYAGSCWGYNFAWPNRSFFAPADTPTIVNTAFIGLAFLEARSALASQRVPLDADGDTSIPQDQSSETLRVARSACEFILHDLNILRPRDDELCFSYTPLDTRFVHNANLLGAWLLAAVYALTGEEHLAKHASDAARFTVRRQCSDGSWYYGIASRDKWIDNFHTGYVLTALKHVSKNLRSCEFDSAIHAGFDFWRTRMFDLGIIPKYYPDRVYPIDIHSVAQAILTWLEFSKEDTDGGRLAWETAEWAVNHMQDPEGFFYYQIRRFHKVRIPYMRWSQAWMQLALTRLINCPTA